MHYVCFKYILSHHKNVMSLVNISYTINYAPLTHVYCNTVINTHYTCIYCSVYIGVNPVHHTVSQDYFIMTMSDIQDEVDV